MEHTRKQIEGIKSKPYFRMQLENELRRMKERSKEEYTELMSDVYKNIRESKLESRVEGKITFKEFDAIKERVAAEPLREPKKLNDFPFTVGETVAENLKFWTLEIVRRRYLGITTNNDLIAEYMFQIYAYNNKGDRLYLIKSLSISEDQYVYLTYHFSEKDPALSEQELRDKLRQWDNRKDVPLSRKELARYKVIKWVNGSAQDGERNEIYDEIDIYSLFEREKIPQPNVDTSYMFYNQEILVMDPLRPIDPEIDNYAEVGIAILSILEKFHRFGCHSDIKLDNIMASLGNNPTYYLIDMGGVTTERYEYGYKRKIWSPLYASQVYEKDQVTTAKYDLIELGYTLGIYKKRPKDHKSCRLFYPEEIDGYMNMVKQYPDDRIPDSIYDDLSDYFMDMIGKEEERKKEEKEKKKKRRSGSKSRVSARASARASGSESDSE